MCYSWEVDFIRPCVGKQTSKEKTERVIFHTHIWGFSLGLHPLLCSHAVEMQASHPTSVFLISSRCWEAVRFSALVSDILHLPWEAGQPCHSNVKHMWNRPRQCTHSHKHTPFPVCMRINNSETIEMQQQRNASFHPRLLLCFYIQMKKHKCTGLLTSKLVFF